MILDYQGYDTSYQGCNKPSSLIVIVVKIFFQWIKQI